MAERMSDRMSDDVCHVYFQMVCQKLCQNNVPGWGSLQDNHFAFSTAMWLGYQPVYSWNQPFLWNKSDETPTCSRKRVLNSSAEEMCIEWYRDGV